MQDILPPLLKSEISEKLGIVIHGVKPLGGGMINQAVKADTNNGPLFIKWCINSPNQFFQSEATGLQQLKKAGYLTVPEVIAFEDDDNPTSDRLPGYLVLEYIGEIRPESETAFAYRFAEQLAGQHQNATADAFGFMINNYIGRLPQKNTPQSADWPEFYRDYRIRPQIELAKQKGLLNNVLERQLTKLLEQIETLLGDYHAVPALLHGDLWSGNYIATSGGPVVIDPSPYYGDREIELSFIELFGGFPIGFVQAYRSIYPLDKGYERRRRLHQLYPLLVHLNTFGETYGPHVDSVCEEYLN